MSFTGITYKRIAKERVPILRKIQRRSGLYVKNSRELKEIMKYWGIERNEILVSNDVGKLYTSISISKALDLVECILKNSIMSLLQWMFGQTYFEYYGHFY